jgi:pilus assembly protein CpaE
MAIKTAQTKKRIALVSQDAALLAMARGAITSNDHQEFITLEKPVQQVGTEIREMNSDALIVDIDAARVDEFEALQKIKRMAGAQCAIIAILENFNPAAARILFQLKVSDFLVKPAQTSDLVRACNNVLKKPGEAMQVEPQFLAFMPASGGVGSTTLALETAQILNSHGKKSGHTTCVVDLNFQQGSCAEYLDIEPRFDISEIENAPERLDRQLLDVMLSRHASGLSVIAAPSQPNEMRSFKSALVVRLLDLVSAYFDYVVIDLPRIWFPWTETVVAGSNRMFIIADMTVPSIRHARRLLAAIQQKAGKQVNAHIVVNRMDYRSNSSGLNASDVKEALADDFAGGIPNNYRLVRDAVDRGVPLGDIENENNVTQALRRIILDTDEEADAKSMRIPGLIAAGRQFFRRKTG